MINSDAVLQQIIERLDAMQREIQEIRSTMATKQDIANMATKDDIANMATKDDLKKLATKKQVATLSHTVDVLIRSSNSDDMALLRQVVRIEDHLGMSHKL